MRAAWTKEQDAILKARYATTKSRDLGRLLGRSEASVLQRASALGVSGKQQNWTAEQDATLIELYATTATNAELAAILGRSASSIQQRASFLKVKRRTRASRDDDGIASNRLWGPTPSGVLILQKIVTGVEVQPCN